VWGIGYKKTEFLKKQGITTALDLKNYPLDKAKKNLTIVGLRTVQELNGIAAIDRTFRDKRDQIMCSRSFSGAVYFLDELITALADYIQEAVKRLRDDRLTCSYITVFLMTNPYGKGEQYSNQATAKFIKPTAYIPDIMTTAGSLLRQIYRNGYNYRKVMVLLSGIEDGNNLQYDLFEDTRAKEKRDRLMQCFDVINDKYGRGTIRPGASGMATRPGVGVDAPWDMKREFLSPE
jgi:DNA polymerase V